MAFGRFTLLTRAMQTILLLSVMLFVTGSRVCAEDLPMVKVSALTYGTANWELQTIIGRGLDKRHGFVLDVLPLNSPQAAAIALQAGKVDISVQDWLWVAKQNQSEARFRYSPFSTSIGEVIVPAGSKIDSIDALWGARIGVAGGPSDKSWKLLNALLQTTGPGDLQDEADVRFAAPPLLNELMKVGDFDAVLTYWHYAARLRAGGFRRLISAEEMMKTLGLDTPLPMLGWVISSAFAGANPAVLNAFLQASADAKRLLASDESAWLAIKPLMRVSSVAEYEALKAGYIEGIPTQITAAQIAEINTLASMVSDDPAVAANFSFDDMLLTTDEGR